MFSMLGAGAVSAVVGAIIYANLPTRLTIGSAIPTVEYLAATNLKLIEPGKGDAAILEGKNVMKRFFGPEQRWLPLWMGFLRVSTYINGYKTKKAGFVGNMEGEGRLLGG
ncbi:hypothetical protein Mgra_00008340 [Meloidogyne graminicola]|uniref:Uncharacterized protein n=1 Tax=Meloidogyne graminicola TaxID=189291 RepID=A0A8S9ZG32_9BILA|nr:hypothetical protein Mgra_00008340 [Meloidogyne graminicola]